MKAEVLVLPSRPASGVPVLVLLGAELPPFPPTPASAVAPPTADPPELVEEEDVEALVPPAEDANPPEPPPVPVRPADPPPEVVSELCCEEFPAPPPELAEVFPPKEPAELVDEAPAELATLDAPPETLALAPPLPVTPPLPALLVELACELCTETPPEP